MDPKTRTHILAGWKPTDWSKLIGEAMNVYEQEDAVNDALLRYERPLFRLLVAYLDSLNPEAAYEYAGKIERYFHEVGIIFGIGHSLGIADLEPRDENERIARYALGFFDGEPALTGYTGDDDPGAWLRFFLRDRVDQYNSWIVDNMLLDSDFDDLWRHIA